MKRLLLLGLGIVLIACCSMLLWYRYKWKTVWEETAYRVPYSVALHDDDTLRVLMIGDSWAEMHHGGGCDTMLATMLCQQLDIPVKVLSQGRGGALSRQVYNLMFKASSFGDSIYCMENMLKQGADYCVVIAGINDAAANLGPTFYVRHYNLILRTLFVWHMRPVVIEIPDVDIYDVYSRKDRKNLLLDCLRAWMTGAEPYDVRVYREALRERSLQMKDSIVYVACDQWNKAGFRDSRGMYLTDKVHLNHRGYQQLDSCIAVFIARDYLLKTNSLEQPVSRQPE